MKLLIIKGYSLHVINHNYDKQYIYEQYVQMKGTVTEK